MAGCGRQRRREGGELSCPLLPSPHPEPPSWQPDLGPLPPGRWGLCEPLFFSWHLFGWDFCSRGSGSHQPVWLSTPAQGHPSPCMVLAEDGSGAEAVCAQRSQWAGGRTAPVIHSFIHSSIRCPWTCCVPGPSPGTACSNMSLTPACLPLISLEAPHLLPVRH